MKKLLTIIAVVLMATSAFSFEAVTSGKVGWLMKKGQETQFMYAFGTKVPIVEKENVGFLLKNETDYLYSDGFSPNDELQVIRTYLVAEKSLFTGTKTVVDSTGQQIKVVEWNVYFGAGSGVWNFIKSEGDDQSFGAVTIRLGAMYKGFHLTTGLDVVQLDGPDIVAPQVGFFIEF